MTDNLPVTPSSLRHVAASLGMDQTVYKEALKLAGFAPDAPRWAGLIDRFLLGAGVVFLLVGVAAFFAYNWADLHKYTKFGLLQGAIVIAVAVAWWRGLDSRDGKIALFVAAFFTGLVLAVYGQVYQTGADPYGLFLTWAALTAGWVLIGRQGPLWMLALVLLNLTLILYWAQVLHDVNPIGTLLGPLAGLAMTVADARLGCYLFLLNGLALLAWEFAFSRDVQFTRQRWYPRVIALGAIVPVVAGAWVFLMGIDLDVGWAPQAALFATAVFVSGCFWYYRLHVPDMFMLTICMTAAIILLTSYVGRLFDFDSNTLIVLALLLVLQTAGGAWLLRKVQRQWEMS